MKKLALFLALCLMLQAVGLPVLAEDKITVEEPVTEQILIGEPEELPEDDAPVADASDDRVQKEPDEKGHIEGNTDKGFVLDDNDYICEYNGTLTGLVLPIKINGVKVMGITETAFSGNTTIQSIAIPYSPGGYTYIENGAFRGCTALESVSMANPIDTIVAEAFSGCTSLKAISWPSGLQYIEHDAFNGCTSLKAIGMTNNLIEIGDNAFRNCSSLVDFDMKESKALRTIGSGAFYGCSSLKAIIMPTKLKTVKNSAFQGCSSVTSVKFSGALKRIEGYTFKGCSAIRHLDIPSRVTYIGTEAFNGCSGLDYVNIPSSVVRILKNAFTGITANTVLFMRGNFANLQISENGLGTTGIILGRKNQPPHVYAKNHSGVNFISLEGEKYIKRVYSHLLARSITFSEKLTQIRNLAQGKLTAATLVKSIADSSECASKNWNRVKLIKKLYKIMLNRAPTTAERNLWIQCYNIGMTRDGVINGIARSAGHISACSSWLLTPGSIVNANYRDRDYNITFFVHRAYQYAFYNGSAKKVTVANLETGCNNLLVNGYTGYKFLHSLLTDKTYTDQKFSNLKFVKLLYQIYLNRNGTATEWTHWYSLLQGGKKRDWVEEEFAASKEFKKLCADLGIVNK